MSSRSSSEPAMRHSRRGAGRARAPRAPHSGRRIPVLPTAGLVALALGAYGIVQTTGGGAAISPSAATAAQGAAAAKAAPAPGPEGAPVPVSSHRHDASLPGDAGAPMPAAAGAPTAAAPVSHAHAVRKPADKASRDEMARVMALVPTSAATAVAVRSGAWTAATTWRGGVVPAAGARVVIPAKVTVTYATTTAAAVGTIRVDGTLAFDPARRSRLVVETIVVTHTGTLQAGTRAAPIGAGVDVVFAGRGPVSDPYRFGRGLISMGRAVITGRPTTAFLPVTSRPARGARTLTLSTAPVRWAKGDTVTVSGTAWRGQGPRQDERRKIAALSGRTLTLDSPLRYDHRSPVADAGAYVAHSNRTVTFSSASAKIAERGHVMFMHSDAVTVHGAAFVNLGRTDKTRFADTLGVKMTTPGWTTPGLGTNPLGRYALHLHRAGLTPGHPPISVSGNAIVNSPGWGLVNHSSNVVAKANVALDVLGSAYVSEVGDETGSFVRNIAIGSKGITQGTQRWEHSGKPATDTVLNDMWFSGIGFGMRSNAVALVGNVATDQADDGFSWNGWDAPQNHFLPQAALPAAIRAANRPVPSDALPVLRFKDNVSVANYRGAHFDMVAMSRGGAYSLVEDFTAVNSGDVGVLQSYSGATLRRVRVVNTTRAKAGIELGPNGTGTRVEGDFTVEDVVVRGFQLGIDNEKAKHMGDSDRPADTYAHNVTLTGNTKQWSSLDPTYFRQVAARPAATLTATSRTVMAHPWSRADVVVQVRDGLGAQKPVTWMYFGEDVKAALKRGYYKDAAGTYVRFPVSVQSRVTTALKTHPVRVGVVLSEWGPHGPLLKP